MQPETIWKKIYENESFITFATTNIDHVHDFILKTYNTLCVERLLQLTVDMKSETVNSETVDSDTKKIVASQILRQLLQVVKFEPHKVRVSAIDNSLYVLFRLTQYEYCNTFFQEAHERAAIALVEKCGADPLDKPEGGGECTVTLATRRGPAFLELSVVLFEYGCQASPLDLPKRLEQLINEGISDDAVSNQGHSSDSTR